MTALDEDLERVAAAYGVSVSVLRDTLYRITTRIEFAALADETRRLFDQMVAEFGRVRLPEFPQLKQKTFGDKATPHYSHNPSKISRSSGFRPSVSCDKRRRAR